MFINSFKSPAYNMDTDLEFALKTFDHNLNEIPSMLQNYLNLSKENNTQAFNFLTEVFRDDEEILKKNKILQEKDAKEIQELEDKLKELEAIQSQLDERIAEINPIVDEKVKNAERLSCPDLSEFNIEKVQLEEMIIKLKVSLSIHINVTKVKWNLSYPKGLSGKIFKDNVAVPFKFSNESAPSYKTCNELWSIIDK
jgi:hypothetical protein